MSDIAINPVTRRVQFTGNTGTGPFAFTFNVLNSGDIEVYKNTTLLTLTSDYTVSIASNGTGSVTLQAGQAVVSADYLTIIGGRDLERTTDFVTAGDLLASSLNEQLDSNVIMSQQLDESFGRSVSVSPGDVDVSMTLPVASSRASQVLAFTSTGAVTTTNLNDLPELTVDKLNVDNLTLDGNTISTTNTNGNLILTPNGTGDVVVSGDLVVNGTTTTIHSTVVDIADKNITIAYGSADAAAANGAGITVAGADATMNYYSTPDGWEFNKAVTVGYTGGTPQDLGGVLNVYSSSSSVPGMVIKSSSTSVDPKIQFEYSSQIWTVGQDSSSDDFKIINGTNLNSSAEIHINTDGDVALGGVSHYSNYELSVPQRVAIRSGSAVAGIDFASPTELVFDGNVGGTNGSFSKFRFVSSEADKMVLDGSTLKVNALAKVSGSEVSISDNLKFGDDKKAVFGDSTDLSVYFDASANKSYISHTGSGSFPTLEFNTDGYDMRFLGNGYFMIRATPGADVKLMHAGSTKLATTATGIDVTGTILADGLTVGGSGTAQITSTAGTTLELIRSGSAGQISSLIMKDGGNAQNRINSSGGALEFEYGASNLNALKINNNGDINFYATNGTTQAFHWDAADEFLGIGNTAPTDKLHLGANSGSTQLKIQSAAAGNNCLLHTIGTTDSWRVGMNLSVTNGSYEIYDDVNNTTRLLITSSGNTTFKTSAGQLSVEALGGGSVKLNSNGSMGMNVASGFSYEIDVGGSEVMRIDSSGNVGIGCTPSALLQVEAGDGTAGGAIKYTASGVASGYMSADPNGLCLASDTAGITFRTGITGNDPTDTGSEAMRIDSSGNLLVGTTTEGSVDADNLTISGDNRVGMTIRSANSGSSRIYFSDGTSGAAEYVGYITYDHSDNHMRFGSAADEAFRIDGSRNLLVGQSSTTVPGAGNTTAGTSLRGTDGVFISRTTSDTSASALQVNKTTGQGAVINIASGGSTVGSIGTSGGATYISGPSRGLMVANSQFKPVTNTGANYNSGYDIGAADAKFGDLYLSGGIYGEVTMPSQPSFHVTKNAAQNNIPINTERLVTFETESYDVGSNFASSIFTAPVSGKYFLCGNIRIDNVDTASTHDDFQIATSNRVYKNIFDVGVLASDPAFWTYQMSVVADMDAGDTAKCTFFQTGGTAQADIIDDAGRTFFCGILIG